MQGIIYRHPPQVTEHFDVAVVGAGPADAWDYENRLTSVTLPSTAVVSFKYDPLGRRIRKVTASATTIYAYDGDNIVEETNSSGTAQARFAMGLNIDEPLAQLRSSATHFYSADGLGSITSLTTGAGAVAASYTYDTFGSLAASSGSVVNPFRYTAREWDPESALYFFRTRFLDPSIGRFLSEDLLRFEADLSFYRYVFNAPTVWKDPFGLQGNSVDSHMKAAIARGRSGEIENILEAAKDVLSKDVKELARAAIQRLRTKAGKYISENCKGSVNREFPEQMREKTLEEIFELAKKGDELARKARKLLTSSEYLK